MSRLLESGGLAGKHSLATEMFDSAVRYFGVIVTTCFGCLSACMG